MYTSIVMSLFFFPFHFVVVVVVLLLMMMFLSYVYFVYKSFGLSMYIYVLQCTYTYMHVTCDFTFIIFLHSVKFGTRWARRARRSGHARIIGNSCAKLDTPELTEYFLSSTRKVFTRQCPGLHQHPQAGDRGDLAGQQ